MILAIRDLLFLPLLFQFPTNKRNNLRDTIRTQDFADWNIDFELYDIK